MNRDMNKLDAIRFLSSKSTDLSFIVNVMTNETDSAKKLKKLAEIVTAGGEVSTLPFTMPYEGVCINGAFRTWRQILATEVVA